MGTLLQCWAFVLAKGDGAAEMLIALGCDPTGCWFLPPLAGLSFYSWSCSLSLTNHSELRIYLWKHYGLLIAVPRQVSDAHAPYGRAHLILFGTALRQSSLHWESASSRPVWLHVLWKNSSPWHERVQQSVSSGTLNQAVVEEALGTASWQSFGCIKLSFTRDFWKETCFSYTCFKLSVVFHQADSARRWWWCHL